jgi:hypothetical protein
MESTNVHDDECMGIYQCTNFRRPASKQGTLGTAEPDLPKNHAHFGLAAPHWMPVLFHWAWQVSRGPMFEHHDACCSAY